MNDARHESPSTDTLEYVGFWLRVFAALVDTVVVSATVAVVGWLLVPRSVSLQHMLDLDSGNQTLLGVVLSVAPGWPHVLFQEFLPALLVFLFWRYRSATPGKMLIRARIVDADTGAAPSTVQLVIRYLCYYLSILPLGLGLLWVGWDPRKQGWHDKIARTVVVRARVSPQSTVTFAGRP